MATLAYPDSASERTRWILSRRGPKHAVDSAQPHAFLHELELDADGRLLPTATIFLTNRECPFRCLMCDLWQSTTDGTVPVGAIPAQIAFALGNLAPAKQIKLYNSGSFFDPKAIPTADHPAIAELARGYERVVVECHPAFIGDEVARFARSIPGQLEVAMGLETAHPEVLEKLNKRMTLGQFANAAALLKSHGIALRVFILVKPPFLGEEEALRWAERSVDFAFDCGADAVSLIPTRLGNGALEDLLRQGSFGTPKLATFEKAVDYGVGLGRGRVFADLWDLEKFSECPACFPARRARLEQINATQKTSSPVACPCQNG